MSLGEAVVDIGANTAGFRGEVERGVDGSLKSASQSVQNFGKGMQSVGTKMTAGITVPLVGVAAASLKIAGDFDQTMSVLQAATGSTSGDMAKFEEQAKSLGASTVFSANEAAEAMLELGKAGQSTTEIMATVPEVMNLAATEGLALDNAAGIVTATLSQFGMNADESAIAVNALAGASNASRSSVASLAEGMKFAGSAAAGIGMDVQETSAALAALSQAGLDGGIAGTSLAGIFNRLVPTTKRAKDSMKALGLDFTDANGKFDDMATIAQKLQNSFEGMDEESRKIAIGDIFGRDAGTIGAVNALISEGAEGIKGYQKATEDQSAAANLADARMKGLKGAIEQMSGAIETAGLSIGQALTPLISKAAEKIGSLAEKFANMSPTAQRVVLVIAGIAAAIGPLLVVAGTLIASVGAIAGAFAGVSAAVLAPVAAIALIVGAVALLLARSEKAREVVMTAFTAIKTAVMTAIGPIVAMLRGQLLPAFNAMWPIIEKVGVIFLQVFAGAVVGAVKGALQAISGIVQVVTGVVQVVSGLLTGDFSRAWDGIQNIVGGVLGTIIGLIQTALSTGILIPFRKVFGLLKGVVTGGWNALKGLFTKGTSALSSVLKKVGNLMLAPFRSGFNLLKKVVTGAWNAIKGIFTGTFSALSSVVKKIGNLLLAPFRAGFNFLKGLVRGAWKAIKGIFTNSFSAIGGTIRSAWGVWRGIVQGGINALKGIFTGGWNAVKSATTAAWNGIKAAVSNGIETMMGIVRGVKGKITGAFDSAKEWLKSAGDDIIKGLGAGIEAARKWLKKKVENLSGWIPGWIKKKLGISSPAKALIPVGYEVSRGMAVGVLNGAVVLYDALGKIVETMGKPIAAVKDLVLDFADAINRSFEDIEPGPAVSRLTEQFDAVAEAIAKHGSDTLDSQKRLAEAEYRADQKRLKKKYDGKDEKKQLERKLKGLEKAHNAHLRTLEREERKSTSKLQALAVEQRNAIMAQAAEWDTLALTLEGVRESYDNALSDLQSKTEEMNGLAASVADNLRKSVWGATANDLPPTFDSIISGLLDQEAAAKRYGEVMQALAGLGLNETSFQQIVDEGVNGLAAAEALLASGQAGVDQVNALQDSINSYAQTAGDTVAEYLLGAGVALAQSTVDSFAAQEATLVSQMTVLGQAIAEAFATAMAAVSLPEAGGGGGGGGKNKHAWVPIGKKNRKCSVCGKRRNAAVHTNRKGSNASGSMSTSGDWDRVEENEPVLVRLPEESRGYPAHTTKPILVRLPEDSQNYPAYTTERMANGSQQPIEIHVHMPTGDPEAAAQSVMNRLAGLGR